MSISENTNAVKEKKASRSNSPMTDRNNEMKRLYENGMTLQKIGDKYGISRQRVHQILMRRLGVVSKRTPIDAVRLAREARARYIMDRKTAAERASQPEQPAQDTP